MAKFPALIMITTLRQKNSCGAYGSFSFIFAEKVNQLSKFEILAFVGLLQIPLPKLDKVKSLIHSPPMNKNMALNDATICTTHLNKILCNIVTHQNLEL